jgi:hypothetical protein
VTILEGIGEGVRLELERRVGEAVVRWWGNCGVIRLCNLVIFPRHPLLTTVRNIDSFQKSTVTHESITTVLHFVQYIELVHASSSLL